MVSRVARSVTQPPPPLKRGPRTDFGAPPFTRQPVSPSARRQLHGEVGDPLLRGAAAELGLGLARHHAEAVQQGVQGLADLAESSGAHGAPVGPMAVFLQPHLKLGGFSSRS